MGIKIKALISLTALFLSVPSFAADSNTLRLVDAVKKQDQQAVRSLLEAHADVNSPAADGATALSWAAHWNDLETADLLIRAGANVNAMNDYGVTALWEACNNGSAALVEKLAQAGADPNAALLRTGETALMKCAETGNADAVKSLIARGANVNTKEHQKGQTALMWAIEERHPEAARVLIENGVNIFARSKGGFTPLLYAARQGDIESAQLLLGKGAPVNETEPGRLQPLLVAIDCGHEALAIFLLGNGANPNARIKVDLARIGDRLQLGLAGATPFLLAAATGDVGIMRALLTKGADPKLATNDRTTPLMVAAGVGRREDRTKEEERQALEAVKLLIELGADVNAANRDMGLTAMHGAAYTGSSEIIRFLVDSGAKLDPMDKFGQTPLSIAEGDPNGLSADYNYNTQLIFTPQVHKDAANILRKLTGVNTQDPGPASASAN